MWKYKYPIRGICQYQEHSRMARTAGPNELQTSLRLSRELYNGLDAAREGRPLGEEIRRRLEASLSGAPPAAANPTTAHLLAELVVLSDLVEKAYGNWHADPGAYAVFQLALVKLVEQFKPKGDPVLKPLDGAPSMLRDTTDPETAAVAASLAATIW
jgi:hypothetical protein